MITSLPRETAAETCSSSKTARHPTLDLGRFEASKPLEIMASADQLAANLEGLGAASFANEAERVRARDTLFEALRRVQSPWDVAWEHNWVNGSTSAAIKTLIDAGVFAKWAEAGWHPITCPQLADLTGAETQLLRKFSSFQPLLEQAALSLTG